ncbi:MAG: D-alanyl-D-alanine carboxypeptidase/D-alanyl-D-alanine endopeptidase [Bacteriovoracaceae bacterium]
MIRLKNLSLLFAISYASLLWGALPLKPTTTLKQVESKKERLHESQELNQETESKLKRLLKKHGLSEDSLSLNVQSINEKKNLFKYRTGKEHIPASVTKIFTTFFALKTLGPNHRFQTTLAYDGKIKGTTLKGNLYLIGGGDPYFTSEFLLNFALELYKRKIYKIEGNYYFDDSHFPRIDKISLVGMDDHTYNSSVTALSSDFNRIRILFPRNQEPSSLPKLGSLILKKSKEKFGPGEKFLRDFNVDMTSLSPPEAPEKSSINDPERWFSSSLQSYSRVEEIPLRNPSLHAASKLNFYTQKFGLFLPTPIFKKAPKEIQVVSKHQSHALSEISKLTLHYSNNLMAESILLEAAQELRKTKSPSLLFAATQMKNWLKQNYKGFNSKNFELNNGSGLSSGNILTAQILTDFLTQIAYEKFNDQFFWTMLAASAHSGFLTKKYNDHLAAYNIWAKTGSLDYVNNIAGYLFSRNGQLLSFSLLIQNLDGRKVVDGPNSKKAESYRQKAKTWRKKTSKVIEEVLALILSEY